MSIVQAAYAALQQEGYRPRIGEDGALVFSYYGQAATFRARPVGAIILGELNCVLPRPEPDTFGLQAFQHDRPLCRLSGQAGQAMLTLETMLIEQEVGLQIRSLLRLLDQYSADYVWGTSSQGVSAEMAVKEIAGSATEAPTQPDMNSSQENELVMRDDAAVPAHRGPSAAAQASALVPARSDTPDIPAGWEQVWPLLNPRFHPLASALAGLGAPPPREVQMDMVQGQQVRGTAIMLWGTPPEAVVVCEQGQIIPSGYQGGTWYKHQTAEQVAQETLAYLKLARLA